MAYMFKNSRGTWGSMHALNSLSKRTFAIAMSCILNAILRL